MPGTSETCTLTSEDGIPEMAAGKCGVLVVLLAYNFIITFLENYPKIGFEGHLHSCYAHSNKLLLKKQLGYGKKILMDTFLYPCWYPARQNDKAGIKRQVNGGELIICVCLLSGDIHQCPGPMREVGPRNTMPSRPTTGARVCLGHPNAGNKRLSMSVAEGSGSVRRDAGRSGGDPELGDATVILRERDAEQDRGLDPWAPVEQALLEELEGVYEEKSNVDSFMSARGLHLLHLNVGSLLPRITEI